MQTYYLSGSNGFTIRTQPLGSGSLILSLQDMTTLQNETASLSSVSYNTYESLLSFTASISSATTGSEYRATLIESGSGEKWHGSFQVFRPQSVDKANYTNQNNGYISNVSENKYIILD
jgi:hypothetical protein